MPSSRPRQPRLLFAGLDDPTWMHHRDSAQTYRVWYAVAIHEAERDPSIVATDESVKRAEKRIEITKQIFAKDGWGDYFLPGGHLAMAAAQGYHDGLSEARHHYAELVANLEKKHLHTHVYRWLEELNRWATEHNDGRESYLNAPSLTR